MIVAFVIAGLVLLFAFILYEITPAIEGDRAFKLAVGIFFLVYIAAAMALKMLLPPITSEANLEPMISQFQIFGDFIIL